MKGNIFFYHSDLLGKSVLQKIAEQTGKQLADYMAETPTTEASQWGVALERTEYRYQYQTAGSAKIDISGRELLVTAAQVLKNNQRLEYYSADQEYEASGECQQLHFDKGNLSGLYSGVKFRGALADILRAYDDIMGLFGSLRLHMISISCTKSYDGLTAEIQLEYDDYIVEKEFFTKIVNNHPSLRMMAISIPEGRWENWFFFTSGSYSTSIKAEEIRYERTADPDYYWAKSTYFDEDGWLLGDFIFVERERRTDVYPNVFNWSETLEYPSHYWGEKSLRFCAVQTRHAKKIVLPDVAQYIIGRSFSSCANLKEIVMPSVTKINSEAFFNCKALKKLVVSEKLVCIEDMAFVDCGNFKVEAPSGSYAEKYFGTGDECPDPDFVVKNGVLVKYTGKAQTVIVPEGVREIGETVFYGNKKVFEVVVSNSVETIRKGAFYECVNLEKIILSEGLKTIAEDAFSQCTQLQEIIIPKSVTQIGMYAFYGCASLTAVSIPEGITTIAESMFAECKNLQKVILSESIKNIESQAFARCKNLADITIPQNVASIGDAAFIGCSALTAIDIPPGVTQIGFSAFQDCKNLARVSIPDVEITYGTGAFSGCRKLADKKKMVIIANILFDYLGHEEHVVVPDGVIALGDEVLNNIQLKSATVPESVIAIGPYTFPSWNEDFVLHAPAGSYAETYAKEKKIKFEALEITIEKLPEQSKVLTPKKAAEVTDTDTLAGKTFVVTGDLYHYASRDVLKGIIEARGGKLTGSISSKTTALITNFPDSGTTKIQKARQLGIEIITEEKFLRCYLSEQSEDTSKSIQPQLEEDTEPQAVGPRAWETLFLPWILERGRDYADQGKVSDIREYPGKVCARIIGQDSYDISITYNKTKEIQNIQCTCPYAAGANYCKHSAALLCALDLDLKPLAETEDWDEFDEESDFDGEETEIDEVEDDFDGDGREYVTFNLILGIVPDFDTTFNSVVKTIKSFLSNIPGAKSWSKGIQADRANGEVTIEEDPLSHDAYEAIFPKMCEEIAKKYPNLPFQGVAEYSELRGDSGEVCLVRYFENKLSVLNIASGCRLAICPECDADVMSLVELAETLINNPDAVLVCEDCGAEFTSQELFEDDWGLSPNWVINTYDMAEMPSSKTGSAVCMQTDALAGKTFVVTGDLYHYENREALKEIVEARGGKLSGSVSSKTTALVTNFPDSGTAKIKKAKELGVEIITEEKFIRRYLSEQELHERF